MIRFGVAAMVVMGTSSLAAAEDHVEVAANFVVASETSSTSSAGHPGGQLMLSAWFGQFALDVELGGHEWSWDSHATWAGIGGRVAVYDGSQCPKQCAGMRIWLDAGVAHENWSFDQPDLEATSRERNVTHFGVGADVIARRGNMGGASMWLRVQHGDPTEPAKATYGEIAQSYETNLMFGIGVILGGS